VLGVSGMFVDLARVTLDCVLEVLGASGMSVDLASVVYDCLWEVLCDS